MKNHCRLAIFISAALLPGCRAAQQPTAATKPQLPAKTGVASFYGSDFAGKKTASGEPFRPEAMTAASRTLPLGTHAQVRNVTTGQSTIVRINDRGPYVDGRLIDLSRKAARNIGLDQETGLTQVSVKPVFGATPAPQ